MNETPPQQDPQPGGAGTTPSGAPTGFDRDALHDFDRLRRSTTDRKIAGVAGGLGRHLNIDPTILRVLLVVLVFFGGAGLLLYAAAWLLIPEDGSDEAAINTSPSTRTTVLIVVGVLAALLLVGDSWGGFGFPWPLAIIALVVVLILVNKDRPRTHTPPGTPGTTGAAAYPGPATFATTPPSQGWVGDTTSYRAPAEEAPGYEPSDGGAGSGDVPPPAPPSSWHTGYASPAAPRPSKKDRGPKLFGFTLAFVVLAMGVLGLYDATGGSVVDAAYPALALTVIGVMLVWGSVSGRPGGLIFLGIVASLALAVSSAADEYGWEQQADRLERPRSATAMPPEYRMLAGTMTVDLTAIDDLEALDGRELEIRAEAGEVRVIVPDGVDVDVDARIGVGGEITVDNRYDDGRSPVIREHLDGGADVPTMNLDIDLSVGAIDVRQEAAA